MDYGYCCFFISNWSFLGELPQSAVADMAFNMGCATLHEFRTFKSDLEKSPPDYSGAGASMRGTLWCRQVGNRCSHDVDCMK